jgi:hypothetical protein
MANRVNHQDTVARVLKSKAVDFGAIGKMVAELGPELSLADEPWESFCGTMRYFVRVFVLPPVVGPLPPIDLGQLGDIGSQLKR